MAILENIWGYSIAYAPNEYYNSESPTLAATPNDHGTDAQGRISMNFSFTPSYVTESQTTPDTDLMDRYISRLGQLGRWYLLVRGTGSLAMYTNSVQATTPVSFNSGDLWILVDVGADTLRPFTSTHSLRVWGASPVKCGALYFLHRPLVYNAVDVLVASPPNTVTVTDAGSIAATVADYSTLFDGALGSPYVGPIFEFTPGVSPSEGLFPLFVARGYNETAPPASESDPSSNDDFATAIESAVTKNGTYFGDNNPSATDAHSNVTRITPAVCQVPLAQTGYPPAINSGGSSVFDNNDLLDIYLALEATSPAPDPVHALIDQVMLVRNCAQAFFTGFNDTAAPSFAYSWLDGGGDPVSSSYDIVVTDQQGDPVFGDGNVLQTYSNVTSPTTVSGLAGPTRVYLLPKTADGSFGCVDYDQFVAASGQIIRYR